ncbi:MAG: transcriptional regulator [Bradyrhizobium sp.]|nr:transcriptional regulator [Bradyrhizobium sp.]
MTPQSFAFGPFVLDTLRGTLERDGRSIAVGQKGLLLLDALVRASGRVVTKSTLMRTAWTDAVVEEGNLTVQIAALRKLLGPQANGTQWIVTVPRIGYRFVGDARIIIPGPDGLVTGDTPPARTEKPSIAVLPLVNVSGDQTQDYLADGITEDIITALTRFRWFHVVGRSSSFSYKGRVVDSKQIARELDVRYLLEGSVRRSGDHVRISTQLVDAASAKQIWAERYAMEMTEAFAVQDAIAERVAGAIEPELLKTESFPASPRHSGNVTAWDLVRLGTWHFHQVGRDTHLKARELFRRALALDPDLGEAHLWLARASASIVGYDWSESPEEDMAEGLTASMKAVQLDERNPYAHYALAICSACANAPEQAVLAAEKSIEISSSFALGHLVLGMGHLFRGHADAALSPFERGFTLSPYDPQNFVWYNLLALAYLLSDHPEEALTSATRGRKIRPAWRPIYETLACCHAALGRPEDAQACIEQMRILAPAGSGLGPLKLRNPHWADRLANLLRHTGWH